AIDEPVPISAKRRRCIRKALDRELHLLRVGLLLEFVLLLLAERLPHRVELGSAMEDVDIPRADDGAHQPRTLLVRGTRVPDSEDQRCRSDSTKRCGVTRVAQGLKGP